MSTDHTHQSSASLAPSQSARAVWVAVAMAALIGLFFLLREHWGHVAGNWPYLLLLACPVMHLFHGGHGHHGQRDDGIGHGRHGNA